MGHVIRGRTDDVVSADDETHDVATALGILPAVLLVVVPKEVPCTDHCNR